MKFLVCISKVPDTTSKINFTDNDTRFDSNNVQFIMNPTDEWYALVRAIELKESLGGTVTVINVGLAENEQVIRKALAIGADDAVRINAEASDAYFVAGQIATFAKNEGYDLILTGKETIDYNGSMVASMIAAQLDLPVVSLAIKLDVADGKAQLEREIEGGIEFIESSLPLVVSCQKGMAEQRIPNMRGIMMSRSKPIQVVEPDASIAPLTQVAKFYRPEEREAVKLIDPENVDELVRLLSEEAKVI